MGKRWRKYEVGGYRLGTLRSKHGPEAVVCYRDAGGPHRRRLGVFTEEEGRVALDRFVGNSEALRARETKTVQDIFDAYVADRKKDGKLVAAFNDNWKALAPRFGRMQVADITADICRDYMLQRMDAGRIIMAKGQPKRLNIGVGTIWTELTRLRSCLNWAKKRNIIDRVPYVWIPSKPDPKQRVLSQEEIWRLYENAGMPHIALFIALALATGGRSEAILGLQWPMVDYEAAQIDLREKAAVNPLTKKVRKGRAVVPMSDEIRAILMEHQKGALTDHVIEWDGAPVKNIRKGFRAAVERAGLGNDVTPHTLRHTVASAASEAGVPMLKISRFLGHKDSMTTERIYTKTRADTLKDVNVVSIKRRKA
jgi:integrase